MTSTGKRRHKCEHAHTQVNEYEIKVEKFKKLQLIRVLYLKTRPKKTDQMSEEKNKFPRRYKLQVLLKETLETAVFCEQYEMPWITRGKKNLQTTTNSNNT